MGEITLVTGGAGFIGSHIVDRLVNEGFKVRVIEQLKQWRTERPETPRHLEEVMIGYLKKTENVLRAVNEMNTVFHFLTKRLIYCYYTKFDSIHF
ncbi:UDP-glucose 4-epimerase [Thermoproteus uzoniensis 768-20]|uniref:UDP-glucose 4-epimerase n=1 Tax=Thermoproteus uzoniensis (strain 768-20) TaxID=999630 RepID=F2L0P5_THEU7|nr:NAD-dependent epimerase/dehydratase family protein [Thermoproteus uzoniensis]AEA11524.1 UDP-glucose 4-epimerase [Thermoproteus uzoniensis 768-20]